MNLQSISVLRRVGVAAGVTAAAALGGGVAMGATASSTTQPAATVAACTTAQLSIWWGEPGGAAAGSSYFPLEFSNIGTTSCSLDGYPGVSGVSADGDQLGSAATWNPEVTPSSVVLAPGGTAHVIVQIADVYNYPTTTCEPTAAYGLRVYPPNQKASVEVPYSFEACTKTGANYLGVDAVNAGVGIPLYTNS
jgi:Protein of unknown function (DUF4232)